MKNFRSERGAIKGFFGWIGIGILVLVFALFFGVCSLFGGDNNDKNGMSTTSFGTIELIDHDYECYDEECGWSSEREQECEYGGCNSDDDGYENSKGRNRGAFSPGPFDRSPVDFRDNCISLDCSGKSQQDEEQASEESGSIAMVPISYTAEPQSLFPPTPEGIRDFVVSMMEKGIEMGRLFADTIISFVTSLFIGLA